MSNLQAYQIRKSAFVVLIVLLTLSNVFHVLSYLDRRGIREQEAMTREMLDSRGKNQIIYFNALTRAGILTTDEQLAILANWKKAEYDLAK